MGVLYNYTSTRRTFYISRIIDEEIKKMIYAYDKVYLRIAQRSLGEMLSYAVYDLGYELEDYYKIFLQSKYSMRFSKGDLFVITGMSGAELAIRVLDIPDDDIIMPSYNTAKSQEYWTGWILAYYQWENGKTFEMIDKEIPICKIRNMYNPYHEMDISSAILKLREMSQVSRAETYLKNYAKGLVSVRAFLRKKQAFL